MSWSEQVFRYCERGQDPSFWAEPLNALSNVAYLIVAGVAAARLLAIRTGPDAGRAREGEAAAVAGLVALTSLIGIGSFLFHTVATRWARLADVLPISMFMGVYLVFALRAFVGWSWSRTGLALLAFLAASGVAASLACPTQTGIAAIREPCLKGAMGYVPALIAMGLVGTLLRDRHPAGRHLLMATAVFIAAMIVRWVDMRMCGATLFFGRMRGTHALWHLLTAGMIHLLLAAALAQLSSRRRHTAS